MHDEPEIIIVGINFWPEPTGNSVYTSDLAGALAEKLKVRVITGVPHYPWWRKQKDVNDDDFLQGKSNIELLRRDHFVPQKHTNFLRFLMELSFGLRVVILGKLKSPRILLISPAMVSSALVLLFLKLSRKKTKVSFWVQDLYEQGLQETQTSSVTASRIIAKIENWSLENSDRVIFPHNSFLQAKLSTGLKFKDVSILPNWSQFNFNPTEDAVEVRSKFGLGDKKLVLHIGNMGVKQGLENVVEAAKMAERRKENLIFVLVGSGNQLELLKSVAADCQSIVFIPPVQEQDLSNLLSAADILLVNEKPGVKQMSIPSKLTTYFQTGKPVLVCSEQNSLAALEVVNNHIGSWVRSGNPEALLNALLGMNLDSGKEMALRAQSYATNNLSRRAALEKFVNLLIFE